MLRRLLPLRSHITDTAIFQITQTETEQLRFTVIEFFQYRTKTQNCLQKSLDNAK